MANLDDFLGLTNGVNAILLNSKNVPPPPPNEPPPEGIEDQDNELLGEHLLLYGNQCIIPPPPPPESTRPQSVPYFTALPPNYGVSVPDSVYSTTKSSYNSKVVSPQYSDSLNNYEHSISNHFRPTSQQLSATDSLSHTHHSEKTDNSPRSRKSSASRISMRSKQHTIGDNTLSETHSRYTNDAKSYHTIENRSNRTPETRSTITFEDESNQENCRTSSRISTTRTVTSATLTQDISDCSSDENPTYNNYSSDSESPYSTTNESITSDDNHALNPTETMEQPPESDTNEEEYIPMMPKRANTPGFKVPSIIISKQHNSFGDNYQQPIKYIQKSPMLHSQQDIENSETQNIDIDQPFIEEPVQRVPNLKRSKQFTPQSLLRDTINDLTVALEKNERIPIVTDVFSIVRCLKSNTQELTSNKIHLIYLLRQLITHTDDVVRVAGLYVSQYVFVNEDIISFAYTFDYHLFLIMCLERSDKYEQERTEALKVYAKLASVSPLLFPLSLLQSLLTIAESPTDLLFVPSLKLLSFLLVNNPTLVCTHGGIQILIEGIVYPQCQSIANSILLSCLYIVTDPGYRCYTTVFGIQELISPILNSTPSLQMSAPMNPSIVTSTSNLSPLEIATHQLLLSLRTWSGIFTFCSGKEGLYSVLNMIGPNTDKTVLISVFKFLFELLGIPSPVYKENDNVITTLKDTSIYWNNCSSYMSSVTSYSNHPLYNNKAIFSENTNTVTVYLAFIVWILTQSKLVEYISETIISDDKEVLFYSNQLFKHLSILNSLLIPGVKTNTLVNKTIQPAKEALQFETSVKPDSLDDVYKARAFLTEAGVKSTVLYVTYENNPFKNTGCSSFFGDVSVAYDLLTYLNFNEMMTSSKGFHEDFIFDDLSTFFTKSDIPFQNLVISSFDLFPDVGIKYSQIIKMADVNHNTFGSSWKWNVLTSVLYKALINDKFIEMLFQDNTMIRLEQFFRCTCLEKPTLPFYLISRSSFIYFIDYIMWLILMLKKNVSSVSVARKTRIFTDYTHSLNLAVHGFTSDTPHRSSSFNILMNSTNTGPEKSYDIGGIFTPHSMQFTYSYYYFFCVTRILASPYVSNYLLSTKWFNLLDDILVMDTPRLNYLLRAIISALNPTEVDNIQKKRFLDIMEYCFNPNSPKESLGIFCICRLKSLLRSHVQRNDFISWVVPILVRYLSVSSSISALIIDILYENCTNSFFLNCIIENKPQLSRLRNADLLIYRIITDKDGFELVQSQQQLCYKMLTNYLKDGMDLYVQSLDEHMMDGVCVTRPYDPSCLMPNDYILSNEHKSMTNPDFMSQYTLGRTPASTSPTHEDTNKVQEPVETNNDIQIDPAMFIQSPLYNINTYLKGGRRSLEWIFSIPWTIHGKIVDTALYPPQVVDYIDFECYPDISLISADGEDELRIIGISTDIKTGLKKPIQLTPKHTVYACLFIGGMYISKLGDIVEIENLNSKLEEYMSTYSGEQALMKLREYIFNNIPLQCWNVCTYENISKSSDNLTDHIFSVRPQGSKCTFKCMKSTTSILNNGISTLVNDSVLTLHSIEFKLNIYPKRPSAVVIPPHYMGALAYTSAGRNLLISLVKFDSLVSNLNNEKLPPLKRRSILWAFTHIALAPQGLDFLNSYSKISFFDILFHLALYDNSVSLRGTALYCISYLSQNPDYAKIIAEHNWVIVKTAPVPLALPLDIQGFLSVPVTCSLEPQLCSHYIPASTIQKYSGSFSNDESALSGLLSPKNGLRLNSSTNATSLHSSYVFSNINESSVPDMRGLMTSTNSISAYTTICDSDIQNIPPVKPIYKTIIEQIAKLVNTVKGRDMHIKLIDLKTKNPELFMDPILLIHVHHFFSVFPLSRTARKFIFQLFGNIKYDEAFWTAIDSLVPQTSVYYSDDDYESNASTMTGETTTATSENTEDYDMNDLHIYNENALSFNISQQEEEDDMQLV